jgi:hypothetical protein
MNTEGYGSVSYATPDDVRNAQSDPLSPTLIAQRFLQQQGMPLTSENMRRALTANANNPGYIPGLMNNEPASPTPPMNLTGERSAAMSAQSAGGQMPTPPIPPSSSMSTVQNSTGEGGGLSDYLVPLIAASAPLIAAAIYKMLPLGGSPASAGASAGAAANAVPNTVPGASAGAASNALTNVAPESASPYVMPPHTSQITPEIGRGSAPLQLTGPTNTLPQLPPGADPTAALSRNAPMPQLPGSGGAQLQIPHASGVERAEMRRKTNPKVPVRIRAR